MKKFKKILTICLALMMVLTCVPAAFAAEVDDCLIDEDAKASLTIWKYDWTNAYKDGVWNEDSFISIRSDILSRKIKATAKDVEDIIQATPAERPSLIEKLRVPPEKPPKENSGDKRKLQRISEEMGKPGKKATQADMLYELNDAISAFILRWKTCLATNAHYLGNKECNAQVQQLTQMGLDYLNQIKNGEIPK